MTDCGITLLKCKVPRTAKVNIQFFLVIGGIGTGSHIMCLTVSNGSFSELHTFFLAQMLN